MGSTFLDVVIMFMAFLAQRGPKSVPIPTQCTIFDNYDFVIIGGGSAGSTLANRLSEVPLWKILLLEAGGQETDFTRTPVMYPAVQKSMYDWNDTTTPQKRTCQDVGGKCAFPRGKCAFPRGKLLGGSRSISAMIYTRGYRSDYDKWGQDNCGWSFGDVEPYFLQSEGNRIPGLIGRGRYGPLTVSHARLSDRLVRAGSVKGLRYTDCAEYEDNCILHTQSTIRDGVRCSASTAYLEPIVGRRENLHVVANVEVSRIVVKNNEAKGVEFTYKGREVTVEARNEVIVSAGAVGSPKILMLSGIGPKQHLESLGIRVAADLPVGDNLQDHTRVPLFFQVDKNSVANVDTLADRDAEELYYDTQTGPYSYSGIDVLAWAHVGHQRKLKNEPPNVQYHMGTFVGAKPYLAAITTTVTRPKSIGTIKLSSSNPKDDNYYDNKEDWQTTFDGLKFSHEMFQTKPLTAFGAKLYRSLHPKCAKESDVSDFFNCMIKYYTLANPHPVGTVKMSPKDKAGVVNNNLQVYGIDKLRVIDASIAPTLISMNTNAMAIMIGEKGADIIKKAYGEMTRQPMAFCNVEDKTLFAGSSNSSYKTD